MKATPEKIASVMLTELTMASAAKSLGISEVTLWRRLQEDDVREACRQSRRQVVEHALTSVQAATTAAVLTLRACLSPSMPASIRLRAATAILDTAVRAIEVEDLMTRVDALEAALKEQTETRRKGIRAI
jgi:hypothetical protein